jgi:hypothetical protein
MLNVVNELLAWYTVNTMPWTKNAFYHVSTSLSAYVYLRVCVCVYACQCKRVRVCVSLCLPVLSVAV